LRDKQCESMSRTTPESLLRALRSIADGQPEYLVTLDEAIIAGARLALERMLEAS